MLTSSQLASAISSHHYGENGTERSAAAHEINEARRFFGDSFSRVAPEGKRLWTMEELTQRHTPQEKEEIEQQFRAHLRAKWARKYGF